MVVGARTIKSYGWEEHYITKIKHARSKQSTFVFISVMLSMLGLSVFQNGGLFVTLAIFIPKWKRGELLDESNSISVMAMVYYIFISINMITYWAMTNFQLFLAVIYRVSQIFIMSEYQT